MKIENELNLYHVIRRDGSVHAFEPHKIRSAIANAFLKDENGNQYHATNELSASERESVDKILESVCNALARSRIGGGAIHIEDIQDQVELELMRSGEHKVARGYVLYRQKQADKRAGANEMAAQSDPSESKIELLQSNGATVKFGKSDAVAYIHALDGSGELTEESRNELAEASIRELFQGAKVDQFYRALELTAKSRIERDSTFDRFAARVLLDCVSREVLGQDSTLQQRAADYNQQFANYIKIGIENDRLDPRLAEFDLQRLTKAIVPARDMLFDYLGIGTIYDRYLLQVNKRRIEMPQWLFMRVAMGLALNETDREARVIEFYNTLSSFDFMSSTPTLFNAGTQRPQLSSCYLTTIADDLGDIYMGIRDNAMLQKYAGGLGNDWTPVRAMGAHIKGTNGESQGVIPYLKVVNDTAIAVNQGGKRKGAVCAYLETWHLDIEEFLALRKNTGDDRRRTHDMNTANWIPDLFMQRVQARGTWTLFSPDQVPDLHDLYGQAFKTAYEAYEKMASEGNIRGKTVEALKLWRDMLSMLFETGHPWLTFKDPCNVRSPQQHAGVVHSSNLCTEITLNTSADEIAVCNLGSVNLAAHVKSGAAGKTELSDVIDLAKLKRTVTTALRMLDNVIDINLYNVPQAENSNRKHRPVGLGSMGFQDALHMLKLGWHDKAAEKFADMSQQAISAYAIEASAMLAKERGPYQSYPGSLWSKGIFPQDTLAMLERERGERLTIERDGQVEHVVATEHPDINWGHVRALVSQYGMRNSNCLAIAPTATIANITGVEQSIEPMFGALRVKSNMAGEFTVVNKYLQKELRDLGLWDAVMVADLKHFDGTIQKIDRIPQEIRDRYRTAFEIESLYPLVMATRRQMWIDQAQSLNTYMAQPNGKKLDAMYMAAWKMGLKTTYYLRSSSASQVEKSTGRGGEMNAVATLQAPKVCSIDNPECESCQ